MNGELNLFFTIDKSYVQHFTVALTSVLENNNGLRLNIYLIHDIEDFSPFNYILTYFSKRYGATIHQVTIDSAVFERYKVSMHLSRAVYFRLLLADILPSTIDYGLFIDSDVIVTHTLKELTEVNFGDNYLMAYYDINLNDSISWLHSIGIAAKGYFNAGVMLVNLKKWREDNISAELLKVADQYMHELRWWDQDILNIYFHDKWALLDRKFNTIDFVNKFEVTPTIIHYATSKKPWHIFNYHPYRHLYWKYKKLTPFKHAKAQDFSYKNLMIRQYRLLKRRFQK